MSFNAFTSMNYPSIAYARGERVVRPAGVAPAEKTAPARASLMRSTTA